MRVSQMSLGFPVRLSGRELACQCRRLGFEPWVRKIPWRRNQLPTPIFLPGEFHGWRSLAGCIVHGVTKSQTRLSMRHTPYKWLSWVSQWWLTSAFVGKTCHLLSWSASSVLSLWSHVHLQFMLTRLDTRTLPSGASRMSMPLKLGTHPGHL